MANATEQDLTRSMGDSEESPKPEPEKKEELPKPNQKKANKVLVHHRSVEEIFEDLNKPVEDESRTEGSAKREYQKKGNLAPSKVPGMIFWTMMILAIVLGLLSVGAYLTGQGNDTLYQVTIAVYVIFGIILVVK